jgi:hypothetical protein
MTELFWLDDPANLFTKWKQFVPTNDMKVPEALNAVVRFTIYSSIIVALFTHKTQYLMLVPVVMATSVILVRLFPNTQTIREAFNNNKVEGLIGRPTASPTPDNPFMNVVFTDYVDNPDRPAAPPDITTKEMEAKIAESFAHTNDLFLDTTDTYGLMQSARQWVTQAATTIPNDLEGYQNFLNKDNVSRKSLSEDFVVAKGSTSNPIKVG